MEFLLGMFAGPFILFGALSAGLAWWAWVFLVGGLIVVEAFVINDKGEGAFAWLIVVSLLVAYILTPNVPDASWYSELLVAVKMVFIVMLNYLFLGILSFLPLWAWFLRKRLVSMRSSLYGFVQSRGKSGRFFWLDKRQDENAEYMKLTPEQIKVCSEYQLGENIPEFLQENWLKYRNEELERPAGSNDLKKNLDTVSSFIFLWPFHIFYMIFGDFLVRIPELFVRYFGPVIDFLTRFVRIGIPDNIDK